MFDHRLAQVIHQDYIDTAAAKRRQNKSTSKKRRLNIAKLFTFGKLLKNDQDVFIQDPVTR